MAETTELPSDEEVPDDQDDTGEPSRKKQKEEEKEERTVFIFYGFECRQDNKMGENAEGDLNLHEPNLVVADKVCDIYCLLVPYMADFVISLSTFAGL